MGRAAAGALAAFIGGVLADRHRRRAAVALAGIVGVVCAIGYVGLRAPAAEPPPSYSARESIRALRERPALSRIALAQGFYGGGLIAATPLFALVHVDRLNLILSDVGVLGILAAVATTVAFPLWGPVADRWAHSRDAGREPDRAGRSPRVRARAGSRPLVRRARRWDRRRLDRRRHRGGVSDQTPLASRAAAMAGWNAITGAPASSPPSR